MSPSSLPVMLSLRAAAVMADPASGGATPDAPQLDPVSLILHASIPVKAVLVLLLGFSIACWLVIGAKALHLGRAKSESTRFIKSFDAAPSFDAVAQGLTAFRGSPFARIFAVAYDELTRLTGGEPRELNEAQSTHIESVTRRAATREVTHLESWMGLLGTIGSTAPFIGLLGTVWGVMSTFAGIAQEGSATMAAMAPGVSAALVTTVAGLLVAIPSMFGYNWLVHNLRTFTVELDNFAQELVSRMETEFLADD